MLWKTAHALGFVTIAVRVTVLLLTLAAPAFGRSRRHVEPRLFSPKGSLQKQNEEANRLRLPRIQTDAELHEIIQDGELSPIHTGPALRSTVPQERAYLRPWAADTLTQLSEAFHAATGSYLTVDSAVRSVKYQKRLRRWNRNAAPATGELASVHTTGIAFDLSRRSLTPGQRRWLQWRLFYLQARGLVIVEEEVRHQSCFHVVAIQA